MMNKLTLHFKISVYLNQLLARVETREDIRSRIAMAKKIMLDLVSIRRDRRINKELNSALAGMDGSHQRHRRLHSDER